MRLIKVENFQFAKQKSVHQGKGGQFKPFADEFSRMRKEYEVVHHDTNGELAITPENSFSALLSLNTVIMNQIEPEWLVKTGFASQIEIKNNHKVESHMDSFTELNKFVSILPSVIKQAAEKKTYKKGAKRWQCFDYLF